MDESFVAKLLDVGTELELPAGHVLVDAESPLSGLLLVLRGLVAVETEAGEDERGRARWSGSGSGWTGASRCASSRRRTSAS